MIAAARVIDARQRLLEKARRANDRAATAILEADRTWAPEPDAPPMLRLPVWSGLRWTVAA